MEEAVERQRIRNDKKQLIYRSILRAGMLVGVATKRGSHYRANGANEPTVNHESLWGVISDSRGLWARALGPGKCFSLGTL